MHEVTIGHAGRAGSYAGSVMSSTATSEPARSWMMSLQPVTPPSSLVKR
jgi:hypothetical protein